MQGRQAEIGRAVRQYLEALLMPRGGAAAARGEPVFGLDADLVQEALLRLVQRARGAGGTDWVAGLLERTDVQLGRLLVRLVRHAAAEQSPTRAYFRALRLHVEDLVQKQAVLPSPSFDPANLQLDGRIQRALVEHAVATVLEAEGWAAFVARLAEAGPRERSRAISLLTRRLVQRYPPLGGVTKFAPVGGRGSGLDGIDPLAGVPDPDGDGLGRELEFWRHRFAPRVAGDLAALLGSKFELLVARLRGATLAEIAEANQVARSTVEERLKWVRRRLADDRNLLYSQGTMEATFRHLAAGGPFAPPGDEAEERPRGRRSTQPQGPGAQARDPGGDKPRR